MSASMRDVAAEAGVSPATVSRVLRADPTIKITAATRERVHSAAKLLQYRTAAVRTVPSRMSAVGVLLPPGAPRIVRHPFFSALLDGIVAEAAHCQITVTLLAGHPRGEFERLLEAYQSSGCQGLLALWQPRDDDRISRLLEAGVPLVLLDDRRDDPRLSSVEVESRDSSRRMLRYLFDLGHRRVALLAAGPEEHEYVLPRVAGYREAHAERGLDVDETLILYHQNAWEPQTITDGIGALLQRPLSERPTALFTTADDAAAVAISALAGRGLRVPEDFSVAGFNDDRAAALLCPPLTTLRQPYDRIGSAALELLRDRIDDPTQRGRRVVLPAELVVRGSTAPPRPV